jgi:hypothetical protein
VNLCLSSHTGAALYGVFNPEGNTDMRRSKFIRTALGLTVAIGLCGARTEKIWTEIFGHLDLTASHISQPLTDREPFDPNRVPQSGGMASRLLSGIKAKLV